MKPRRPQGRNLLGAPIRYWPVAQSAEHSAVNGEDARSKRAWPATFTIRRDGRAAQGGGLLNRRGDESRVGSNPTLSTTCTRIAQLAERRSYKAEVLGSNPSACTGHAALAQWIQEFLVSTQEVAGSSPARRTNSIMASSHSGLVALPRKQRVGQPARRFESFTRRHTTLPW